MKSTKIFIKTSSLMELPTPSSISFLWNMGFLLGMTMVLQIISGIMLSMNFISFTEESFNSVIHIMRDMESGWAIRYLHMNGASMFFIFMMIHIARGIYFNSPQKTPMVWMSGIVIILMAMMTAFMGYVLPWGQMSYWGATVITSMISSIPYAGNQVLMWLWGNYSVSQPTLNRMLSLHFLLPFIMTTVILIHLLLLHKSGSSNPSGNTTNTDKMKFIPYFMTKDLTPMIMTSMILSLVLSTNPEMMGDPENFNQASMTSTPTHIKPEWYFLFAYAILRCIPSKLGGVVMMVLSIVVLVLLMTKKQSMMSKFNPSKKMKFWSYCTILTMLTWAGSKSVNEVTMLTAQILTTSYFSLTMIL